MVDCSSKVSGDVETKSATSVINMIKRLRKKQAVNDLNLTMASKVMPPEKCPTFALIPEVYDDENAYENFEIQLERALEDGYSFIIIEPSRLGDETARWIAVGNFLHKTAVIAGMVSVATAFAWSEKPYICLPLGVLSLLCTGVYTLSWQFDPCVKYQVETDLRKLLMKFPELDDLPGFVGNAFNGSSTKYRRIFPSLNPLPTTPVVLVRQDNSKRKMLHSGLSIIAAFFCMWRLYNAYK